MTYNAKVGMRKPKPGIRVNLSKGEYVVNATAASAQHRQWLDILNWGNA